MKRIASALLSGFMLIGFTSCDQTKAILSDTESTAAESISTTTSAEITTESTTIETSESGINTPINMTLDDIRKDLFTYYDSTARAYSYSESLKKAEYDLKDGIKDYFYLYYYGPFYLDDEYQYFIENFIFILELDMDSDFYKNLKPGDKVKVYKANDVEMEIYIASINGQYALSIFAAKEDDNEWHYTEHMPDFTIGNTPDIYDKFNSYQ